MTKGGEKIFQKLIPGAKGQPHTILKGGGHFLQEDVRDAVEVATSGHPANIDAIIPLEIRTLEFDEVLKEVKLKENPTFLKSAMVIVSCGSGIRSAIAANKLTADGYTEFGIFLMGMRAMKNQVLIRNMLGKTRVCRGPKILFTGLSGGF